jgi:hypothetical protein
MAVDVERKLLRRTAIGELLGEALDNIVSFSSLGLVAHRGTKRRGVRTRKFGGHAAGETSPAIVGILLSIRQCRARSGRQHCCHNPNYR